MSDIEDRIREYVDETSHVEVSEDEPVAMALAPVQAGLVSYIDVSDLPDMDALPYITERKRDFAFRYAMEYKSIREWSVEYKVTVQTIHRWLGDPGVRAYVAVTRYEKRMFTLARRIVLENRVYDRLMEFLKKPLTNDNASAMEKALEFAYDILNDPSHAGNRSKAAFNRSVGMVGGSGTYTGPNPYAQTERDVSPPTEKQLKAIEERLEQARLIMKRSAEGAT